MSFAQRDAVQVFAMENKLKSVTDPQAMLC